MKENQPRPWMLAGADLRKDAPFFTAVGLLFGITQFFSYHYFSKANWGGNLLLEQIPIYFLFLANLFLWGAGGICEWQRTRREMKGLKALIAHVRSRTVGFATASASAVFGFAMAPALWGAYWHACMFLICGVYLLSLGGDRGQSSTWKARSRMHCAAMLVIITVPFTLLPGMG